MPIEIRPDRVAVVSLVDEPKFAHDFFMRGRIRTLDEIKTAIDSVTLDQVNAFLKKNPPGPFTIVIVGPKELKTPV